jgi:hypothetical protein
MLLSWVFLQLHKDLRAKCDLRRAAGASALGKRLIDQPLGPVNSNEDEEEGEPADKPGSVVDSHSSATHVAVRL